MTSFRSSSVLVVFPNTRPIFISVFLRIRDLYELVTNLVEDFFLEILSLVFEIRDIFFKFLVFFQKKLELALAENLTV